MNKRTRNFRRAVLGDVFEIQVSSGLAYGQYINYHRDPPHYGHWIRVFDRIYPGRPKVIETVLDEKEQFLVFYPLGSAVNQGLVTIVANLPVPKKYREFPMFKNYLERPTTGVKVWFSSKIVGADQTLGTTLPRRYYDCPFKEIVTHAMLVHMIESGWTARTEI